VLRFKGGQSVAGSDRLRWKTRKERPRLLQQMPRGSVVELLLRARRGLEPCHPAGIITVEAHRDIPFGRTRRGVAHTGTRVILCYRNALFSGCCLKDARMCNRCSGRTKNRQLSALRLTPRAAMHDASFVGLIGDSGGVTPDKIMHAALIVSTPNELRLPARQSARRKT
jgi:hypothetical protein